MMFSTEKRACTNPDCEKFDMQILPSEAKFCPKCGKRIVVNSVPEQRTIKVEKNNNSPTNLFQLGFNYENGVGVPNDVSKALQYYTQAANQGDWRARNAVERLSKMTNSHLNRYQIFLILRSIISNKLGVRESEIVEMTHLQYDLDADSLDVVELIVACEMKFNIDIPDDDVWSLSTVKDAVNYIALKIR